jgi:hypothetical protein
VIGTVAIAGDENLVTIAVAPYAAIAALAIMAIAFTTRIVGGIAIGHAITAQGTGVHLRVYRHRRVECPRERGSGTGARPAYAKHTMVRTSEEHARLMQANIRCRVEHVVGLAHGTHYGHQTRIVVAKMRFTGAVVVIVRALE